MKEKLPSEPTKPSVLSQIGSGLVCAVGALIAIGTSTIISKCRHNAKETKNESQWVLAEKQMKSKIADSIKNRFEKRLGWYAPIYLGEKTMRDIDNDAQMDPIEYWRPILAAESTIPVDKFSSDLFNILDEAKGIALPPGSLEEPKNEDVAISSVRYEFWLGKDGEAKVRALDSGTVIAASYKWQDLQLMISLAGDKENQGLPREIVFFILEDGIYTLAIKESVANYGSLFKFRDNHK